MITAGDTVKLKFATPVEIEVVDFFDESTDSGDAHCETFSAGETVEALILDIRDQAGEKILDLQFGDGACSFTVPARFFELLDLQ